MDRDCQMLAGCETTNLNPNISVSIIRKRVARTKRANQIKIKI